MCVCFYDYDYVSMLVHVGVHVLFLQKILGKHATVLVKKKVAKHTRTLREGSRGACAREAFALFAY